MGEWRLFEKGTIPDFCTAEWYDGRESAPHVEQGAHRPRLEHVARLVNKYAAGGRTVVDLGCGDGGMMSLLDKRINAWGYDLCPNIVVDRGVDIRYGNVLEDDIEWADIAVATEMIEHLVDPGEFLRMVADNCNMLIASSPMNENGDAHYEFHAWAWDVEGYKALFERNGWRVARQEIVWPFQIVVAKKP